MNKNAQAFSAEWLAKRLKELAPKYPQVSLCVALSGGVDSTALLAALATHKVARLKLRAIHVNHALHPNAKHWAAQCRALAKRLRVPLKVVPVKINCKRGTSLEAEARKARYEVFARELRAGEVLLTAHHEDDQLETVLLQLLRGAGLPGIAAMPDLARFGHGWMARPLLPMSRAALEAWAGAQPLEWVEDDTNLDERFDRNYLRRQVLPLLKTRWPGAGRAVSRSARHAAEAQRLLDALALADVERAAEGQALSAKALRALSVDRRRNALRFWITQQGAAAPNTKRLEEIAGPLLVARAEASPKVEWEHAAVQRRGDLLLLTRLPSP